MRYLFLIMLACSVFTSCKKSDKPAGDPVELYLLKSFALVPGKCQVDASSATLEETPLVYNRDIMQYSKKDYQYSLTDSSFQKLKSLNPRTPFAITVDKQVIFYGIYMPAILSSSCDHSITMDVGFLGPNRITMRLGYPGILPGTNIDDQRNNAFLLAALDKQGKLK